MTKPQLVVFDLDQTLILRSGFQELFCSLAPDFGINSKTAFQCWHTNHGMPLEHQLDTLGLEEETADQFISELFSRAESLPVRALPGAHDLLAALKREEVMVAVSTGSGQAITESALRDTALSTFVDLPLGSSRDSLKGVHHLQAILEYFDLPAQSAAAVGDGTNDMLFAREQGFTLRIGLLFPDPDAHTAQDLLNAGATHLAEDLFSVMDILT